MRRRSSSQDMMLLGLVAAGVFLYLRSKPAVATPAGGGTASGQQGIWAGPAGITTGLPYGTDTSGNVIDPGVYF